MQKVEKTVTVKVPINGKVVNDAVPRFDQAAERLLKDRKPVAHSLSATEEFPNVNVENFTKRLWMLSIFWKLYQSDATRQMVRSPRAIAVASVNDTFLFWLSSFRRAMGSLINMISKDSRKKCSSVARRNGTRAL